MIDEPKYAELEPAGLAETRRVEFLPGSSGQVRAYWNSIQSKHFRLSGLITEEFIS